MFSPAMPARRAEEKRTGEAGCFARSVRGDQTALIRALIHVAISVFKYPQLVARLIGAMKIRSFRSNAGSTKS